MGKARLGIRITGVLGPTRTSCLSKLITHQQFEQFSNPNNSQLRIMSTTRLTFLYPHLFRSIRAGEPISQTVRLRARPLQGQCCQTRNFATLERRQQRFAQRHGKAVEPAIPEDEILDGLKVFTPDEDGKDVEKGKELKQKGKGSNEELQTKECDINSP